MKSLVTVLGLLCALQLVHAQMRQEPCLNLPGGTGFANDYSSCQSYFSCINFHPFSVKCPLPFFFNENGPFGPICDWPFNLECQSCPPTGVINIADPYHCHRYRACVNGVSMDRECSPGTAFDQEKGQCVIERDAICNNINTCGKLEGGTGNAPSTKFCDEFIVCYNGEQFGQPIRCPSGLKFDSTHMRCAIANEATCYPGTYGVTSASLPIAPTRRMF